MNETLGGLTDNLTGEIAAISSFLRRRSGRHSGAAFDGFIDAVTGLFARRRQDGAGDG